MIFIKSLKLIVFLLDLGEIRRVSDELSSYVTLLSGRLVRQLKRRDKNAYKLQRNFDILTAILQAVSLKRRKFFHYFASAELLVLLSFNSSPAN
jgi:hypothetical protein